MEMTDSEKLQKNIEGIKAIRQNASNVEALLADPNAKDRVQSYTQQIIVACDALLSPLPADAPPPGVPGAKTVEFPKT